MLSKPGIAAAIAAASLFVALLLTSTPAQAYPWMIRHHYAACSTCHYDPSGAGAITDYGRAVADQVIRMGGDEQSASGDLPPRAGFLYGLYRPPAWLDLGGDFRVMGLSQKVRGAPLQQRLIWMQLDGSATLHGGGFVASGTLGYAPEGALGAAITRGSEQNLVSRQHWLGYQLPTETELMLRVGRMNLPFGLRTIEHTLWTKAYSHTNINDAQQYGASLYVGAGKLRGELMTIAGNLQLRPDRYRERGYSLYLELEALEGLALGVSSLVTHRDLDPVALAETWRQAHGAFGRWATPYQPLVFLTEWDYVFESSRDAFHKRGLVSYLQADWEPVQGAHFLVTGEANHVGIKNPAWSYAGWLSYAWFFGGHGDVRLDGIYQSLGSSSSRIGAYVVLLQGHVFL